MILISNFNYNMRTHRDFKKLLNLSSSTEDFQFQSIGASLVESAVELNSIMLSLKGQHKRCFSTEIGEIKPYPFNKNKINLEIRLDGIYDKMPETFFHDIKNKNSNTIIEMVHESNELRREELARTDGTKIRRLMIRLGDRITFLMNGQSY